MTVDSARSDTEASPLIKGIARQQTDFASNDHRQPEMCKLFEMRGPDALSPTVRELVEGTKWNSS